MSAGFTGEILFQIQKVSAWNMPLAILFAAKGFFHQVKTTIENDNLAQLCFELFASDKVIHC